jgi:hypothetical protein
LVFRKDIAFEHGAILELDRVGISKEDNAENQEDASEGNPAPQLRPAWTMKPHAKPTIS